LSQTMALLQDVRGKHEGIDLATRTLAEVMGKLYPLAQAPTHRPSRPEQPGTRGASVPGQAAIPREALAATMPSVPSPHPVRGAAAAGAAAPRVSAGGAAAPAPAPAVASAPPYSGPREKLEANVGATTESNFFVGFSGDISEGGVFVATYLTLSV